MDELKLLPPGQTARLLGVTTVTLRLWRRQGVGPPYRAYPRGHVRYNQDEVVAWIAKTEVLPGGERHG